MRGNITRRGKSWQIKFDVSAVDGKRQQRYATVKGSRQDAQKELTRLLAAADQGTLPNPSSATLAEYLRAWLNGPLETLAESLERYRELSERQIILHLGATKLQKLRPPEHVQQWHGALLAGGLSARTVGHAHQVLRLMLQCAVKNGTLARNVAAVHPPPKVEEDEIEILSAEQIADVLAELFEGRSLYPIVSLALATGMRRGELLGLQWDDINLDARTIRVERSLEETNAGLRLETRQRRKAGGAISQCPLKLPTCSELTRSSKCGSGS